MNRMKEFVSVKPLGLLLWISLIFTVGQAVANAELVPHSAHAIVQDVQDQLLATIRGDANIVETDEEAYFGKVQVILAPVVDFSYIARGVMGGYAKQASTAQRERFAEVFKYGLVSTYAKGMASYADRDIAIVPAKTEIGGRKSISVAQEIRGPEGVNRVSYTMKLNREGDWKLVNVVLNGINLGITFRTQFYQAMKKSSGNLDQVIDDWSAE